VGCVPRFVVVRGKTGLRLAEAFERAALGLPHEEAFRDVEIVGCRAQRRGATTVLALTVDRSGGVDLKLCESLATRLDALLADQTESYTLEVESAGLNRPLLHPSDYERFRDRNVRVLTTLPIGGQKTHRGKLAGVRGAALLIQTDRGELPIPFEMVKSANVEYDPRADLARDKRERRHADKVR
jgi:ribosome maturation factor RimP